jgi:hypothetical protein
MSHPLSLQNPRKVVKNKVSPRASGNQKIERGKPIIFKGICSAETVLT